MQSTFTILISEAKTGSWPDIVWTDAKNEGARVYLDYCRPINKMLKKLRKIHFSNSANRKIWLPLKTLWDWSNVLRPEQLDPSKRNYIIFQTGIKFSASYIKKLKEERNACIVLYMPDNIRTMGIARTQTEFTRYCQHFHVDQAYSFDSNDCLEFGMTFFDFYSKLPIKNKFVKNQSNKLRVLYVGNCRSKERMEMLHKLYDHLKEFAECSFYLNGVDAECMRCNRIIYNHPLTYFQVVELVQQNDVIVEIINGTQTGNTLRMKEAVCYNKRLLTNNKAVLSSPYYNSHYMQVFDDVNEIDLSKYRGIVNYSYKEEFSPHRLMDIIIKTDMLKMVTTF